MRCFACQGPYHPATGHYFNSFDIVYCGPCATYFFKWMKGHMKRKWSGEAFYDAASTSIREGVWPTEKEIRYTSGEVTKTATDT